MRAKEQGGLVTVKALVKHPMETGQRKDKSGNKIPEHFIQQIMDVWRMMHELNNVFISVCVCVR